MVKRVVSALNCDSPASFEKAMEVLPCPLSVDFSCFYDGESERPEDLDDVCAEARDALSRRVEAELRQAHGGGVVLPPGLLPSAAERILQMASTEPYGLRGCTLHVDLDSGKQSGERLRLTTVKCAPDTVSTFELFLTLQQETSWKTALPQFLKNLTSGGALVLSRDFTLSKKRLFRSYS
ncbi:protein charybde-like [Schistocerca cancellata]|uniref:protein charybde-like n=1 Tax=Schistocerca cancellata TaxID=274614 RepID=UPI0021194AE6|nr:protein charybde-like [Schistocerca cancellata]